MRSAEEPLEALVVGLTAGRDGVAAPANRVPLRAELPGGCVADRLEHRGVPAREDKLAEGSPAQLLPRRGGLPGRAFAHQHPGAGEELARQLLGRLARHAGSTAKGEEELLRLQLGGVRV